MIQGILVLHVSVQAESSSVQSLSRVQLFATPWTAACQVPVHHQLLELIQTHVHRISDAIQPAHPLSSPSPPAFNLSQHQGLFSGSLCIRWAKYWCFSFSISPSNVYSELMFFRSDWFDLLALHCPPQAPPGFQAKPSLSYFPTPSQSPASGRPGLLPDAAWPSPLLTSPWVWLVFFFSVFSPLR